MDAMGIDQAHVLGEALGAAVSIELASATPARVNKVVLVNCPWYTDSKAAASARADMQGKLRPGDSSGFPLTRTIEFVLEHDALHAPMQPSQSWMDRINVAQLESGRDRWQALGALHQYDIGANLECIRAPVLLLIGEHFHYFRYRDELVRRIPDPRLEIVKGGRFCLTWERAAEIGEKTIAFVR
jgi:pimeloyl-ACP methyl ester carboxylesterase